MRITPEKFYCENDVPGLPDGYDAALLNWDLREYGAETTGAVQLIADERYALEQAGRHVAATGGFSNSAVGEFVAEGAADEHGGRRIKPKDVAALCVCGVCGAPIRMLP